MQTNSFCRLLAAFFAMIALADMPAAETNSAPARTLEIGERAPDFTLADQNDQEFSLSKALQRGPVAVVFIRSIDWCAYCQLQTVQLSENISKLRATGGEVVVVCYDAPPKVKRFTKRRKIVLPVLSDTDSKTIDAYAMRAVTGSGNQRGSAQHGTFVIDKTGVVRSKPYLTSFDGDPAVDALISALKEANPTQP